MKFHASMIATMKIARINEVGAFLDAETGKTSDDILLHRSQWKENFEPHENDRVEVFLYLDPKKRLTASMKLPRIKIGEVGIAKVINKTHDGYFLDFGAERGIFLPFHESRRKFEVGDEIFAKIYIDKSTRLSATTFVEDEIQQIAITNQKFRKGDRVTGKIYNFTSMGAFALTQDRIVLFIAKSEIESPLKIGDNISARVIYLREDGGLNVSLRASKKSQQKSDAEKILDYLESHDGRMKFNDNSSPDEIKLAFGISKSQFKRALGLLLKSQRIKFENDETILMK